MHSCTYVFEGEIKNTVLGAVWCSIMFVADNSDRVRLIIFRKIMSPEGRKYENIVCVRFPYSCIDKQFITVVKEQKQCSCVERISREIPVPEVAPTLCCKKRQYHGGFPDCFGVLKKHHVRLAWRPMLEREIAAASLLTNYSTSISVYKTQTHELLQVSCTAVSGVNWYAAGCLKEPSQHNGN